MRKTQCRIECGGDIAGTRIPGSENCCLDAYVSTVSETRYNNPGADAWTSDTDVVSAVWWP